MSTKSNTVINLTSSDGNTVLWRSFATRSEALNYLTTYNKRFRSALDAVSITLTTTHR